jgi:Spy/CpxP family protein refolding chaperone
MKRLFLLFAFIITTGVAFAQQTQTATVTSNEERAHSSALRFQKVLALTPEQTTQIEGIILARIIAVDAINADVNKTPEQKETEIAQIRKDKEAEIIAVLTPEQAAKYNQMKEDRKKRKETIQQQQD